MNYPIRRKFINELGNEIEIIIRNVITGVEIDIEGPDSSTEEIITEMEFEKLYEAMTEFKAYLKEMEK